MRVALIGSLYVTVLSLAGSLLRAEDVLREFVWSETNQSPALASGEIQVPAPGEPLKVVHDQSAPRSVALLTLENPGISTLQYALTGEVRYEGVEGTAFLEMWSYFSNGGSYFTKTLATTGPMQSFQGSSGWRPVMTPFMSSPEAGMPTKIVLNLVLQGRGTVYLRPLRLVQYQSPSLLLASPGDWWTLPVSICLGAGGGTLFGLLGALIGVLAGLGRARRSAMLLAWCLCLGGFTYLVTGIVAAICAQPYHVTYPLLLVGVIGVVVGGPMLPVLRRRYEQLELRRMAAMDVATARS